MKVGMYYIINRLIDYTHTHWKNFSFLTGNLNHYFIDVGKQEYLKKTEMVKMACWR